MNGARQRVRALLLFGVAGVLALGVDVALLYLLRGWLGNYGARLLSFLCAASFTWLFNRTITFAGEKRHGLLHEYLAYLGSVALGGLINYSAYAACVRWWPAAAAQPAIAVALGSLAGMGWNFLAAQRLLAPPARG
jgi:putative flippase GtrA